MRMKLVVDDRIVKTFNSPDGKTINFYELCMAIGDVISEEFQAKIDQAFEIALNKIYKEKGIPEDEFYENAMKYAYDAYTDPQSQAWKKRIEKNKEERLKAMAFRDPSPKIPTEEERRREEERYTHFCSKCSKSYVYYGYPEEGQHLCDDGYQGGW